MIKRSAIVASISVFLLLGGCATNHLDEQASQSIESNTGQDNNSSKDPRDPLEPVNRVLWKLNWNILDRFILRPATIAYTTIMPQFARTGLLNAVQNLEEPSNIVNNALQGKGEESIDSMARFLVNSTVGLLGVIDVADKLGIARQDEDLDEVLGVWGVGNGPFVMVPARGPTDVRGIAGDTVDNFYYPLTILNTNFTIARFLIGSLETRAALISQEEQIRTSPDDYAFVKNAYFQNKAFQVSDGKIAEPQINEQQQDDFDDFEAFLNDDGKGKDGK